MNDDAAFSPFLPLADAADDVAPGGADGLPDNRNLGRKVTVQPPINAYATSGALVLPTPQDLVFADFPTPRRVTLLLQASGPGTYAKVQTSIGGSAVFDRSFPLAQSIPRALRLFGRRIEVQVGPMNNNLPVVVQGAIAEGDIDALGDLWPVWQAAGITGYDGNFSVIAPQIVGLQQAGVLLGAQGSLLGAPTAGQYYWVQFFDSNTGSAPGNGTSPLISVGPMVGGTPSGFSFDRSSRPDIFFNQGLCYALSTTGNVLTLATDGALVRVDCDWAS